MQKNPGRLTLRAIAEQFVNKTLKELRIRNEFHVDILMIEKDGDPFLRSHNRSETALPSGELQVLERGQDRDFW